MSNTQPQGEMDLIVLTNSIKSFLIKKLLFLFKGVKYLSNQWKTFLVLIIIGIIIAFVSGNKNDPEKEATILLKVNFDAVNYVYDAVSLINQKIEDNDLGFFNEIGMTGDEADLLELKVSPVINLQEIIEKKEFNASEIKTLFENLSFDDNLSMTNSFISNYTYHSLTCTFGSLAGRESVNKLIDFLNTNPLFTKLKLRKINSISDRIFDNENTITQIDNLISKYSSGLNSSSKNTQLYIDSKNIYPHELIKTKIALLKEIEELKEEKIYSNNTVVVINNSDLLVQKNRLRNNKTIFYPLLFCLVFICFQILKSSYNYLDNLEKK
mgnify:CR=1 FL=1